MPAARVLAVAPGSPADTAGLAPGDEIVAVNGEGVRDVIEYQLAIDEPSVELDVRRGGLEQVIVLDKPSGAPLGIELSSAVFDRVRTCDNHCPFCFIYQLPKGLRRSLYLKDDDYRLSFLYGNFTTLTRFTEADLERVIDERLSPLYVSIHATDPQLRTRLLRNPRGATSLRWLELLLDAGIEVHGQVVVCPGVNDGDALHDTMCGILERFSRLSTVGVVPLGVSAFNREAEMRAHTSDEARDVVDTVGEWQERFLAVLGRRLVFASDEYYLLAERDFPTSEEYDDFAQLENGVGMARRFESEVAVALAGGQVEPESADGFFAWVEGADQIPVGGAWEVTDGAPPDGYRAPRTDAASTDRRESGAPLATLILTGVLGARVLEPIIGSLEALAGHPVDLLPVQNRFFGGNIGVTGLIAGADVADAIRDAPASTRVLLPDVALSRDTFLDGMPLADLPRSVVVVPTDGGSLVTAMGAHG